MRKLQELPGEMLSFDSQDRGRWDGKSCPALARLHLKANCKVMLVWNLSDSLKNGTQGIFMGEENGVLFVNFVDVGKVPIERQTWFKVDRNGKIIGQRSQFPLVPCNASTCHKTQRLTLKAAVVHRSREFVPGLVYVAASRVEEEKHLQVLQFKKSASVTATSRSFIIA